LKKYFIQYKPFLLFLLKFGLSYLLLTFFYTLYLNQFDTSKMELDGITKMVATQTETVMSWYDSDVHSEPTVREPGVKMFFQGRAVSRIIEGCNAVSVMILFAAFVIAFSGKLKNTILFILSGILIIHVLNILRIASLNIAIFYFKKYEHILHDVFFPLIIYGVVFILWIIWVNKFSYYAAKTAEQ
jgi:exosortase family protein XrtF